MPNYFPKWSNWFILLPIKCNIHLFHVLANNYYCGFLHCRQYSKYNTVFYTKEFCCFLLGRVMHCGSVKSMSMFLKRCICIYFHICTHTREDEITDLL